MPYNHKRTVHRVIVVTLLVAIVLLPCAVVLAHWLRPPPDPFPRARLLLASGDAAAAERYVRATLERRPRDAAAWQMMGECLRLRGHAYEEAEAAWRRARALAPTWDTPAIALAARALATGRPGEARRLIDETLRRGCNTAAVLRLSARMRARGADFAGAAADLERAAARPGGRARDLLEAARHQRAAAFVAGVRTSDPERLLEAALRRALAETAAADVVRAVRVARGRPDDAAVAANSSDDDEHDNDATPSEHAMRRALALDRSGALREALLVADGLRRSAQPMSLAHAAASLAPQDRVRLAALLASPLGAADDDVARAEARAHLAAARRQTAAGHDALALAHLRAMTELSPSNPDALFALGLRLGGAGKASVALAIADGLPGGAGGGAARRLLGWFQVGAGDVSRAASMLLPRAPVGRSGVGLRATGPAGTERYALTTARATTDPLAARSAARAAAAADPLAAAPRLLLGLLAERRGDAAAACVHHAAALARDPSLAVAANDLAWLLATRGNAAGRALPLAAWAAHLLPADTRVRDTASVVRSLARGPAPSGDRAGQRNLSTPLERTHR